MATTGDTYLTAGVFFALLREARRSHTKARSSFGGKSDGLTQTNMFADLIRVVDPTFTEPLVGSTFGGNVSEFQSCKIAGNTEYLPIGSSGYAVLFNRTLRENPADVLERMADFIDTYIAVEKHAETLTARLRFLLRSDTHIASNHCFLMGTYDETDKDSLISEKAICLEVFLLALWHFFATDRQDNTGGRNTFLRLFRQSGPNTRWRFTDDAIPVDPQDAVAISRWARPDSAEPTTTEPIFIEVEEVSDEECDCAQETQGSTEPSTNNYIQQIGPHTTFVQNGNNGTQIAHVDTLIIGGSR